MGYGNAVTLAYKPRILFSDGTFTANAAAALKANTPVDGRWTLEGGNYVLNGNDGKVVKIARKYRARAAASGTRLNGFYRTLSGVGNASDGVAVVAAWKGLNFSSDGTVLATQGASATTGTVETGGFRKNAVQYWIDGYSITLKRSDGRAFTMLFYFFPDSDNVIGIEAATLSRRR